MELPAALTTKKENYTGMHQVKLLYNYISKTLPTVKKLLTYWEMQSQNIIDDELKKQAQCSLKNKAFHCQGGAVFATPYVKWESNLLRFIVAYQTICDYLDNLCDRANCTDEVAFKRLHESLIDALTPSEPLKEYYESYPQKEDYNYLNNLVLECQSIIKHLPSYHIVYEDIMTLANYYIDLQVKKHMLLDIREDILKKWANGHINKFEEIYWQEFSAASGSTLAIFALIGLATERNVTVEQSKEKMNTYFPWICGLHILLDYFIDHEEDKKGGDLNFTFYYKDNHEMVERLKFFIDQSHKAANQSPFEKTVVEGLLAMYLSDKKVVEQDYTHIANELLDQSGKSAWKTFKLCSQVRKFL
ncbi:hypothetical protein SYNTR_1085 [Candidatus Syntrophocurvum alkaliphilum]|uniref:Tetraprenyl-beta-curcumene synthase n=1 Tax=Candidatus Syntrophocurvum alkaliphilum TaxID=2293317 RepID=A0A6I6DA03_9FIRM|nr:tetraprenyl-beta-curcumene synthase family protein [Candidatus Syntrophocurvum alkaliphilum]QGT99678.1 hypothetical protein SYNTR_1085 [Candidatus Syntrophocurvum alkaliphilum]